MSSAHPEAAKSNRGARRRPRPVDAAQHPWHLDLVSREVSPPETAAIDAIVVPTAREVSALDNALDLAAQANCSLIVLCSRKADAAATADAARHKGVMGVVPVDVGAGVRLPRFQTTALLTDKAFVRRTDTAGKRNLGLAISRMVGWQRVLFLDDDINEIVIDELTAGAALLDRYGAVGLQNDGFADNSVVCHANRDTGGEQGTFVGGGAMLVSVARITSFFPDVYNEDWFVLLNGSQLIDVAMSGTCAQTRYDPYADPDRARQEEFGDCLAEGIFSLLDNQVPLRAADATFWEKFLARRAEFIDSIVQKVPSTVPPVTSTADWTAHVLEALKASKRSLAEISPELCVEYLATWRQDRRTWRRYLRTLPRLGTPREALEHLGLEVGDELPPASSPSSRP